MTATVLQTKPVRGRRYVLNAEPLGFEAGDTNLYRYAGNSPTNLTDPSGRQPPNTIGGNSGGAGPFPYMPGGGNGGAGTTLPLRPPTSTLPQQVSPNIPCTPDGGGPSPARPIVSITVFDPHRQPLPTELFIKAFYSSFDYMPQGLLNKLKGLPKSPTFWAAVVATAAANATPLGPVWDLGLLFFGAYVTGKDIGRATLLLQAAYEIAATNQEGSRELAAMLIADAMNSLLTDAGTVGLSIARVNGISRRFAAARAEAGLAIKSPLVYSTYKALVGINLLRGHPIELARAAARLGIGLGEVDVAGNMATLRPLGVLTLNPADVDILAAYLRTIGVKNFTIKAPAIVTKNMKDHLQQATSNPKVLERIFRGYRISVTERVHCNPAGKEFSTFELEFIATGD